MPPLICNLYALVGVLEIMPSHQAGRGHWPVNCSGTQSFIITLSPSLSQKSRYSLLNFDIIFLNAHFNIHNLSNFSSNFPANKDVLLL